jgi:hypothetical protein
MKDPDSFATETGIAEGDNNWFHAFHCTAHSPQSWPQKRVWRAGLTGGRHVEGNRQSRAVGRQPAFGEAVHRSTGKSEGKAGRLTNNRVAFFQLCRPSTHRYA